MASGVLYTIASLIFFSISKQVERLWRDAKLLEIGGGTNEAHHKNMCRDLKRGVTQLK